jgi:hypothetical protein
VNTTPPAAGAPGATANAAAADDPARPPGVKPPPAELSPAVRAVLEPLAGADPAEPERRTRELAGSHYENFPVVSLLLPRHLRQDFCNIYAFCRVADDLGDELVDRAASAAALADLRAQTLALPRRQCRHHAVRRRRRDDAPP